MNARFAEQCRPLPLELHSLETEIARLSVRDDRSEREMLLDCCKDIYIGVFFDGTNNNKYRDTPNYSQSNVARLYEVYPGTPAAQKAPTLRPRLLPFGRTQDRKVFPDERFQADSVPHPKLPSLQGNLLWLLSLSSEACRSPHTAGRSVKPELRFGKMLVLD